MKTYDELNRELDEVQKDFNSLKIVFNNYIASYDQNEKALRESEKKYRMLVENLNEIIYTLDENAKITYISPNIEILSGYTPADVMGRCFIEFVHPDDLKGRMDQFRKILSGNNEPSEYRLLTSDGKPVWMRTRARPLIIDGKIIGIQGVLTEIADLKETETRLNTLISQTPAIIYSYIITGDKPQITYVNENIMNVLGYNSSEFTGDPDLYFKCIHPDDLENTSTKFLDISKGRESSMEYRIRGKTGNYHWLSDKQKVMQNENGVVEIIGASWDITEKKQAEQELRKAMEKAQESNRLKSSFLSNLSHEVRTPMSGIMGFAHLLKNPDLDPESRENYISIITTSGRRMLDTINQLMDISKIEAGVSTLKYSRTNINEDIAYVYNFFKPDAGEKGIRFYCKTGMSDNEAFFITDREKLQAILVNLVKNAIKFTSSGSIEFGYDLESRDLQFFVRDTGAGISEENFELIFERFCQVDGSYNRNYDGMGLGLPIAKAYVEMLGGKLWVKSEKDKGSEFFFTIPPGQSI